MAETRYLIWLVALLLVMGCGHKKVEETKTVEEKGEVVEQKVVEQKIEEKKDLNADIQKAEEYISSGRYKEAITLLKQLTEIDPENADLYYLLGMAYEEEGQHDLSVHAFIKALQLDQATTRKGEKGGQIE